MKEVFLEVKKKDHKDLIQKKYRIIPGEEYFMGRSSLCNIHIPHFSISRKHAKFQQSSDLNEIQFQDNESQNGTIVNNKKVVPSKIMKISIDQDVSIKLGDCDSIVEFTYVEKKLQPEVSEHNLQCSFALTDMFLKDISDIGNRAFGKQSKTKNVDEKTLGKKVAFKFHQNSYDKENHQNGIQSCNKLSIQTVDHTKNGIKSCNKLSVQKDERAERRQSRAIEIRNARRSIF